MKSHSLWCDSREMRSVEMQDPLAQVSFCCVTLSNSFLSLGLFPIHSGRTWMRSFLRSLLSKASDLAPMP